MLLDQMHIALRERDRDAFLVEAFLHRARDVPVHRPVVTGPGPGAYHEVDRGLAQGVQPDHRLGLGEHQFVALDDIAQHSLGVVDIVRIGDAKDHVHAPMGLGRDVADHIAPDLAVRHYHLLVVPGCDGRRNQIHRLDRAHDTPRLHRIADIERPIDQDHHAGRKVGKGILQGEADDKAGDTETGENRAQLDAELRERDQQTEEHHHLAGKRDDLLLQQLRQINSFSS